MRHPGRVLEILRRLKREFPAARTALVYTTPFELVVATILSAQTTDAQVNRVTSGLFKKYATIEDFAGARLPELNRDLAAVNFYHQKARNIRACARMVLAKFASEIPRSLAQLVELPGVGRKTANIVLSTLYGIHEGIAVDTHVKRLAFRLGLTAQTDPAKIETDLVAQTPRAEWANLSNLLICHGRKTCRAVRPFHDRCVLADICPSRSIQGYGARLRRTPDAAVVLVSRPKAPREQPCRRRRERSRRCCWNSTPTVPNTRTAAGWPPRRSCARPSRGTSRALC